jgi:P27 family predicted phage terminase small subunit
MGFRGPIPVPTAKKDALGIASHHKRNAAEPRLAVEVPTAPAWLDKEARREWRRLMPVLLAMRVVTKAERNIAANYCQNHANMLKLLVAIQKLNEEGRAGLDGFVMVVGGETVVEDGKKKRIGGQLQPHTLFSLYNQAVERETKLGGLLGLDPANRTRLQMPVLDDKPKSRWGDTKPILTSKPA